LRKTFANIFALFLSPSNQIPGLSDGLNKFCKVLYLITA